VCFFLSLKIFGIKDVVFACDIATTERKDPWVTQYGANSFKVPDDLRESLALGLYRSLCRYLMDNTFGTVTAVDWIQPDLRPWLERNFCPHNASRLARLLETKVDPKVVVPVIRPVVETRHD
jgi:hypothetical protein